MSTILINGTENLLDARCNLSSTPGHPNYGQTITTSIIALDPQNHFIHYQFITTSNISIYPMCTVWENIIDDTELRNTCPT